MSAVLQSLVNQPYKHGFVTEIESDIAPRGLNEDIIRLISTKKNEPEWLLAFRLKAYKKWLTMTAPKWQNVHFPQIDFQDISYYSAPKPKKKLASMDEVDPELLRTFEKLGVPMHERAALAGVAVDVIFDSVSVATTYKQKLAEVGIIFCSISEAVHNHPELVQQYLGTVVPVGDNYFAALNSAVFTDGSFCFIPKGVKCPMDLSTYFRINTEGSGQFERTLIIAEEGASVSYLEGCTAPRFDTNQLHGRRARPAELPGRHLVRPVGAEGHAEGGRRSHPGRTAQGAECRGDRRRVARHRLDHARCLRRCLRPLRRRRGQALGRGGQGLGREAGVNER